MDEMQLLSAYRDDQPELTPDRFDVLRSRLHERIVRAPARRVPRTRARRRVALAALGVAVAACTAVAVVTAGPAPQASAAAVRLLQSAATAAQADGDVGGARTLVIREDALAADGDEDPIRAAYIGRTITVLRVPAGDGLWTRTRSSLPTVTFYGGAAARALLKRDSAGATTPAPPRVETSPDGSFTVGELGGRNHELFDDDPQEFRHLPTDPTALLDVLRTANLGAAPPAAQADHVMSAATLVLDSGVADGDLQAAVFRALQQQPGLTVTDDAVDLDGRTGAAISVAVAHDQTDTFQLILDPATGHYLGHRQVNLIAWGPVPAGAVLDSTAITVQ